jgi:hypothetical protein
LGKENEVIGKGAVHVLLGGLLVAGCKPAAETPLTVPPRAEIQAEGLWLFPKEQVQFDARFPRARLSECVALGDGKFGLVVRPENLPVNNSPWFAFQVSAEVEKKVELRLRVQGGNLRYVPKVSVDGISWVSLPAESYQQDEARLECTMTLEVGPRPLWVAAQELVSTREMLDWAEALERLPFVRKELFGRSIGGQSLCRLDIGDAQAERAVVIIGRQHPPETTGSLALMRFVEEITGDSELARSFRGRFHCVVMPLLNPDGVDSGNWRHNWGRTDLNRDWQHFQQPETRAVRDQIMALAEMKKLRLMLDFHSTFKDVFYTQRDEQVTDPPDFTRRWLEALATRLPNYEAKREASPVPTPTTSTYWAHDTFGIPAITYEIGDNTDRALLKTVAATAAQEMMRLMLEMSE